MTGQHLLQDCPLHDVMRQEAWLEDASLRDKLHGDSSNDRPTPAAGLPSLRRHRAGNMAVGHSSEGQAPWRPCGPSEDSSLHQSELQACPCSDRQRTKAVRTSVPGDDVLCGQRCHGRRLVTSLGRWQHVPCPVPRTPGQTRRWFIH